LGDRDSAAFLDFIAASLPKRLVNGGGAGDGEEAAMPAGSEIGAARKSEAHTMGGEVYIYTI